MHITGKSARLRFRDLSMRDLSSNGIGLFGTREQPIVDVTISDCIIENCCNRYPEYLSSEKWEQGSTREDQGLVACYHVEDFSMRGCRLSRSRSDGTHFFYCRRGQLEHNRIEQAKMGGYFLETCEAVIGTGNLMRDNGSRGVTIERGSKNCVFTGNVVSHSGREGLWAPDCTGLVVTSNIFDRNGRKPNGVEPRHVWNANITINEAPGEPTKSPTEDYLVANNVIYTTDTQIAAIRIDANETTRGIVVQNNLLRGENRQILLQGARADDVMVKDNDGQR